MTINLIKCWGNLSDKSEFTSKARAEENPVLALPSRSINSEFSHNFEATLDRSSRVAEVRRAA